MQLPGSCRSGTKGSAAARQLINCERNHSWACRIGRFDAEGNPNDDFKAVSATNMVRGSVHTRLGPAQADGGRGEPPPPAICLMHPMHGFRAGTLWILKHALLSAAACSSWAQCFCGSAGMASTRDLQVRGGCHSWRLHSSCASAEARAGWGGAFVLRARPLVLALSLLGHDPPPPHTHTPPQPLHLAPPPTPRRLDSVWTVQRGHRRAHGGVHHPGWRHERPDSPGHLLHPHTLLVSLPALAPAQLPPACLR